MNKIKKGDKVLFLQPQYTVYNKNGKDIYENLILGLTYTVKEVGTISISLKEVEGSYLKEHFRKV